MGLYVVSKYGGAHLNFQAQNASSLVNTEPGVALTWTCTMVPHGWGVRSDDTLDHMVLHKRYMVVTRKDNALDLLQESEIKKILLGPWIEPKSLYSPLMRFTVWTVLLCCNYNENTI